MVDYANVLARRYAGKEWTLVGDDYSGLQWNDNSPKPTKAELEKLWPTVQAEIAANAQAEIDARESAIGKLRALGLTVDEVQAAFGLKA